jgi:succinate dehydrogenase / fumarate reductase membrane anchor subunit
MNGSSNRTALSRARGLGSAKHGVGQWIGERASSVALAPLSLWAIWAAVSIAPLGYAGAAAFLASPLNAVLAILTLGVSFFHMHIGMRVVIEDYFEKPSERIPLLLLNAGVCGLGGAIGIFCVLKVALLGAGAL